MGVFKHRVEIGPGKKGPFYSFEAVVDTGSAYTWIPASILGQIGIVPEARRPFETADGRLVIREVGDAAVRLDGETVTRLVVFGDEGTMPILGADTLQGFGLGVDPVNHRLMPVPPRAGAP